MGTIRRRKHQQRASRATHEAVEAFRAADRTTLHRFLRLPPWQASPLDAEGDCPWPANCAGALTWTDSVALREEIEAA